MARPQGIEWQVEVSGGRVSAVYEPTSAERRALFVCAHGAGGNMADRGMLRVTQTLLGAGLDIIRFNFPYKEKGSGRPDAMPVLEATITAVVERARAELSPGRLLIGGRSMGGRAASMLAAKGFGSDGLLLLAYPLHPAGQPTKLRDEHLPAIRVPVLCLNGTRDDLCRPDLMEPVLERVGPNWTMHWLEGADHSFHVLKSSGRTDAEVFEEVGAAATEWVGRLP